MEKRIRVEYTDRILKVTEDPSGPVRVWTDPHDTWRNRYIFGCAAVGGTCCACVLDRVERAVVAEIYEQMPPDLFGEQIGNLARHYRPALVTPVVNGAGRFVLARLVHFSGIVRLHRRRDAADKSGAMFSDFYGFLLNDATRESFWGDLAAYVRAEGGLKAPEEYFTEMHTLERDDKGRLPSDLTPDLLRMTALAAAVQGDAQASKARMKAKELKEPDDFRSPFPPPKRNPYGPMRLPKGKDWRFL